jgi:cytidylate kinase
MSVFSEIHLDIQQDIIDGDLNFRQIASKYGIKLEEVDLIASEITDTDDDFSYDHVDDFGGYDDLN